MTTEQSKGNPDTMPSDNKEAQDKVFGSSAEFFGELEREVNGAIDDGFDPYQQPENETGSDSPAQKTDPSQVTPQIGQGNNNSIDWEKRYKDSSREAQRLAGEVKKFSSFEPLLDVMRKDEGLVNHIKDYLVNGGKSAPQSVKQELGLDEDFHYDPNEAIQDPDSDSAKVFNATMEKTVKSQVDKKLADERKKVQMESSKKLAIQQAKAFQKKHELSPKEMQLILKETAQKRISLDDAYYLLNRGKTQQNVANSVRQDVANQMKNARTIPQSVGHSNSARVEKNPSDEVFDALKGADDDVDNLFG
tara:strand:- start:162 stop:1076 length:915 start_codon:yes stop_codon:yes gene_type:complete